VGMEICAVTPEVLASKGRRPTTAERPAPNANANERRLLGVRRWWRKRKDEGEMQTSRKGKLVKAALAGCWTERSCRGVRALVHRLLLLGLGSARSCRPCRSRLEILPFLL